MIAKGKRMPALLPIRAVRGARGWPSPVPFGAPGSTNRMHVVTVSVDSSTSTARPAAATRIAA